MARLGWLVGGVTVGLGAIALATRSARAASATRAGLTGPELEPRTVESRGLGAVAPLPLETVRRVSPLVRGRVSPNGAFRAPRPSRAQGWCRVYPCTHWGVDLVPASYGTREPIADEFRVRAPEDLVVDLVVRDNATPPLSGYGPGAVLALGRSGVWHVFGHLSPASLGALKHGDAVRAGAFFGRLADQVKPPHVHWEPRRWRTEVAAARELGRQVTRGEIVIDPDRWLEGER